MIGLIVVAIAGAALVIYALLVVWLGWIVGTVAWLLIVMAIVVTYVLVVRPWHLRWGATDAELAGEMPGDELLPGAEPATQAITIAATPGHAPEAYECRRSSRCRT